MWAVGVMSYVMLCGYPPFSANALGRLYYLIMKSEFTFKVSPQFTNFHLEKL
jgi:serine/threonine protein kinase